MKNILIMAILIMSTSAFADGVLKNKNCKVALVDFDKVEGIDYEKDLELLEKLLAKNNYTITEDADEAEFVLRNAWPHEDGAFSQRNPMTDKVYSQKGVRSTQWYFSSNGSFITYDNFRESYFFSPSHKKIYSQVASQLGKCEVARAMFAQ
jgi:hypothetical protein